MPEHHGCRKNQCSRVCPILPHNVFCNVTASRLKERIILYTEESIMIDESNVCAYTADVAAWDYTRTTDQGSTDV